jgi:hypothetical protein
MNGAPSRDRAALPGPFVVSEKLGVDVAKRSGGIKATRLKLK